MSDLNSENSMQGGEKKAVSRRSFLKVGAIAAAGTVFLAACGDTATSTGGGATTSAAGTTAGSAATTTSAAATTTTAGTTTAATTTTAAATTTAAMTTTSAATTAGSAATTTAAGTTAAGTAGATGTVALVPSKLTYTGPTVQLSFWNGFTGGAAPQIVPKLIDEFNKAYPNIKVTNNTMQWADYYSKVPAAVRAGQGPDVGAIHGSDPATFAAQQLILPVDDMIQELNLTANDFVPAVFKTISYQNKMWAIPFSVTPLGLYMNDTVLTNAGLDPSKPPTTGDQYMSMLDTLKSKGVQGSWVDPFTFTGTFQFESLLWQFGGDVYNQDISKAIYNSDAGVQALTWMVNQIKNGYSPANVAQDANFVALQNGKTAFNWNGVWQTSGLATVPNLKWSTAEVPQIGTQKGVWSSSTHFAIYNKKGQDQNKVQAAKVFIDWFVRNSLAWAETGEIPASASVRAMPEFKARAAQQPFVNELAYAHFETPAPGIGDADNTVPTAVNDAILMKKSPKQALDDAVTQANQILQRNKQQYQG